MTSCSQRKSELKMLLLFKVNDLTVWCWEACAHSDLLTKACLRLTSARWHTVEFGKRLNQDEGSTILCTPFWINLLLSPGGDRKLKRPPPSLSPIAWQYKNSLFESFVGGLAANLLRTLMRRQIFSKVSKWCFPLMHKICPYFGRWLI